MAVRITLECGHTSMLRTRTTPEGYTHDWEVFVRGVDNADIHHYIEKVVFLLHNTFRNPKRVLKEPPFVVKESGYAGFIFPIEIYLKNKDEPKKFQIAYDLQLQNGPPINKTIRHVEVIRNPSDDFRKKLLKGGAVVVSSRDGSLEKSDTKASTMVGKPKLNGSENKKHRITESKTSNSFHDLFGPPIKTAPVKISPDSKKTSQSDKNLVPKPLAVTEKSDKVDKTVKSKESPHKDSRKDKIDEKKDKKVRDSSKDQLRSKDKSKRPPSPGSKSHSSPGNKRPASPVTIKKPSSPLSSTKRSLSPKSKEREVKKVTLEKEKDSKEKEKVKNNSKNDIDSSSKSEKKKDKKKHKDDRDKERKDKYKESEKTNVKDVTKIIEKKSEKPDKEKPDKEKFQEHKSSKDDRKSPKTGKENDKVKEEKVIKEKSEKSEKPEKVKDSKYDKDRPKHKHKKREKKDKRDSKDREKKEKRDRSKDESEKQNNSSSLIGNPLSSLLTEIPERDSSDSAPSVDDDSLPESKSMLSNVKKESDHVISTVPTETAKPLSPGISMEVKKDKSDRSRRDKSKGNRNEERENRKRKKSKEDDEVLIKREKRGQSTSPPLEPVSSSQSPVAMDVDTIHHLDKEIKKEVKKEIKKEKDDHINMADNINNKDNDPEQVAPDSTISTDADISEPPVFSEDYVSQLKDLQHKIMTLQDNDELQRVVQVIAETGQYEITKKTFDFDLCALDRRTVHRLQQFFSAS
ncbi:PREDICTED: protein AF-9 [Cyphomyrmex costatus]|uniref:Protein ENL n=1 Tax=Cyphomyrmex costatus TaxID=456900 RepID=A0A195D747_9HYME|nr:PREDICTED: protein AF-9 [Cyphomyrmex costatus]KYN08701.1 Protein ENL [Cyphomyrmex costatus]